MIYRPPWNYDLMTAGYLLALVPTLIILAGVAVSVWRFIRQPSAEWFVLLGFSGTLLLALVFLNLTVPHISVEKAFYGLCALVPLCSFGAVGWEVLTQGRKWLQFALGTMLLVWAMNSFASVWIRSGAAPTHIHLGVMLADEKRMDAAELLRLPDSVRELADLALIGTVADVAPIVGENRSIALLGLEQLRAGARPGLAALLERAGVARDRLDLDDIGYAIAPRLNAAGRVGEAGRAARLLLASDPAEAVELASEIEAANLERREITKRALAEAVHALGLAPAPGGTATRAATETAVAPDGTAPAADLPAAGLPAALLVRGEWPVGIIGLIAGRLAEDYGRPAVVATALDAEGGALRASCRSGGAVNLAEALIACDDLLIRHGGHRNAAGFDIDPDRWPEFAARFLEIAAAEARPPGPAELTVDLVLPADSVDYALIREVGLLAPTGQGNPAPIVAVTGLTVTRVRSANGGHTQLVLRRSRDVLDAVAFRRPDLAAMLHEGDRIDVVARPGSRRFGGIESIQLEVIDVSAEGAQPAVSAQPVGKGQA